MSSINVHTSSPKKTTHGGAKARGFTPVEEMKRLLYSSFLWEKSFYESGDESAERMRQLTKQLGADDLMAILIEAREEMKIRHAPLFILSEMTKYEDKRKAVRALCPFLIKRPDDATELVALYWKDGKKMICNSLKKGIADALTQFDEFQLAKYQNKGAVKLVDLFNLTHPVPKDKEQFIVWKKFMKEGLPAPLTWEVELSKKGNTFETWDYLLKEKAVGSFAFLRNIRNMSNAGISKERIKKILNSFDGVGLLPTILLSAARNNPDFEIEIEALFRRSFANKEILDGETVVLLDVSGSMDAKISDKSEVTRMDASCGVAMILKEICESLTVYTFSDSLAKVPSRVGFALRDAIIGSQPHGSTNLGEALMAVVKLEKKEMTRLVVVTDEQSTDEVPYIKGDNAYMINVANYKNGVSFGDWIRINGFSDAVIDFIGHIEKSN